MDLREFIDKVNGFGELKVIEGANWDLEIGAITHLLAKEPNPPALLFDKITGYKPGYRVLSLPVATYKRINLGLGLPLELKKLDIVKRLKDKLNEPLKLIPPVEVKDGTVLQNSITGDDVDLYKFPAPRWQSLDGGRYIGTGDTIIVKDPDEGWVNVGTHRVQIQDKNTATIYFEPGKHGDLIRKKYWAKGKSCPVAVTLGSDPMYVSVGGTNIPWGMPEYDYMGWWRNKPVEVIKGPVTGLPIPADVEIALEGEMMPPDVESRMEGPFSEWPGHYTPARRESAFKVRGILHRDNPIILGYLPFLGPGVPTGWTYMLRAARLWNHLDKLVPGVKGVWQHLEFGAPYAIAISIEQKYGGHAKQVALAALGEHNYFRKFIIVVDDDIDPSNLSEVIYAVGIRSDPDMWDVVRECRDGGLDPLLSPQKRALGDFTHSAVMIMATKPYYWMKDFPPRVKTAPELEQKVKEKFKL